MNDLKPIDFENGLERLITTVKTFGLKDTQDLNKIGDLCHLEYFPKDSFLIKQGDKSDYVYFIVVGLLRFFYVTKEGKERNKSFSKESQFAGAFAFSATKEPSRFFIQALEPTYVLSIKLKGLDALFQSSHAWSNLGRLYLESLVKRKTIREASFLMDTAEVRYRSLLSEDPDMMKRLPLFHIASFLGITDVALSRIRKTMKM